MSPKTLRRTCLAITITVVALAFSPAYAGEDWGSENRGGATEISKQSSVQQQQIPSEEPHSSPDTQVNYSDPKTPRVVAVCQVNKDNKGVARAYCDYGQIDQPAASTEPITLTTRQAATLIAQGSGITRQPPGPKVIISKAFIVYTNPAVRYQTTTILGTPHRGRVHPHLLHLGLGRRHHHNHHRPRRPLPPTRPSPTTTSTPPKHHHHPDHHLDHPLPPHRRHHLAHHRRHHHHHRDLYPLRPRPHHLLPHRRRRRSPRPLTRSPSAASFQTVRSVPLPQVQARHVT